MQYDIEPRRSKAKDYSQFLSPGASGSSGQRIFTARDLDVLKYVAQLRSEKIQRDVIIARLGETSFPEIDESTPVAQSLDKQLEVPVTAVTGPLACLLNR